MKEFDLFVETSRISSTNRLRFVEDFIRRHIVFFNHIRANNDLIILLLSVFSVLFISNFQLSIGRIGILQEMEIDRPLALGIVPIPNSHVRSK